MIRGYTTTIAFLEALSEAGVSYVFASRPGPPSGVIEELARTQAGQPAVAMPRLIPCPDDTVALAAAQAYAMVTMKPQAVIVGDGAPAQLLKGELTKAMRDRVPVLVFAEAESFAPGTYLKDRTTIPLGRSVKHLVHRALQIARDEPSGPVCLVGMPCAMNEPLRPYTVDATLFDAVSPAKLDWQVVNDIASALASAKQPLIVTSHFGRDPRAVPALVKLAELLAIPVLDAAACHLNFPADHPLYAGSCGSPPAPHPLLAAADVILAIDAEPARIPLGDRRLSTGAFYCLGSAPGDSRTPMISAGTPWRFAVANSKQAVEQIVAHLGNSDLIDNATVMRRSEEAGEAHTRALAELEARERPRNGTVSAAYLTACLRRALGDQDALVLNEMSTQQQLVTDHLRANRPGSLLHRGGSPSAWLGGAAAGAKLAAPDKIVVCLVDTGSPLSGTRPAACGLAIRTGTPVLTVIYNHRDSTRQASGSPKAAAGTGPADVPDVHRSFRAGMDLEGMLRGLGPHAYGATVSAPAEVPQALETAFTVMRSGRSAVVNALLVSCA